jgi:hypothetical protein
MNDFVVGVLTAFFSVYDQVALGVTMTREKAQEYITDELLLE